MRSVPTLGAMALALALAACQGGAGNNATPIASAMTAMSWPEISNRPKRS